MSRYEFPQIFLTLLVNEVLKLVDLLGYRCIRRLLDGVDLLCHIIEALFEILHKLQLFVHLLCHGLELGAAALLRGDKRRIGLSSILRVIPRPLDL